MAEVVLAAEVGRPLGSRAVRRLRLRARSPVSSTGTAPTPCRSRSAARELRVALNGEAGANQLLSLDTGSGTILTLAREMQRHPVAQTVTHVDFIIVRRDEVIAPTCRSRWWVRRQRYTTATGWWSSRCSPCRSMHARPTSRPPWKRTSSALTIGGPIRVSDLVLPAGVTTDVDPETAVAIGQPPRVVVEEGPGRGRGRGRGGEGGWRRRAGAEASEATSEEG